MLRIVGLFIVLLAKSTGNSMSIEVFTQVCFIREYSLHIKEYGHVLSSLAFDFC